MAHHIFDHEPEDWRHLEDMVNTSFLEMGYESCRNRSVDTVRGTVDIDVFATDSRTSIPTTVICECKYWNKPISQQIIYAFRSICSDIGAHYGLVISKVGFQSGAIETREATNIHLLDFQQFQEKFFGKWREGVFMDIVRMRDSFLPALYRDAGMLSVALRKYELFEKVSEHFIFDTGFPIKVVDPRGEISQLNEISIGSHRQFYEIAKEAYAQLQ